MHLKLRRKLNQRCLPGVCRHAGKELNPLRHNQLDRFDMAAKQSPTVAAYVHLWSAENCGDRPMLQKKVLIVDDSPSQVRLIEGFLEHEGYRLVGLNDPERVEEMISLERPSVILLDVVMPKRNGFQVCRELKTSAEFKEIPVILVTSKNTESDRFWGRQQGADGYVTKPFTREELLRAVRQFA
jgi:twitching motility two-component system response regulator PilH